MVRVNFVFIRPDNIGQLLLLLNILYEKLTPAIIGPIIFHSLALHAAGSTEIIE